MKNIFKIFFTDLKGLIKNPFALIIAIGICILPSLYAWFNIYSNWDPYANTGNIKIAIYSEDEGIINDQGIHENVGQDVVNELKSNTSIGWTQVESRDEAEAGVERGDYYAAVVICKEFTDALYNGAFTDFKDNPTITYYENEKKNAVATKITDAAVDSLKKNINEKFLNVVITSVFNESNSLVNNLDKNDNIKVGDKLSALSNNLTQYSEIIDTLIKSNNSLASSMVSAEDDAKDMSAAIGNSAESFNDTTNNLNKTQTSVKEFNNNITKTLDQIQTSINTISKEIESAKLSDSVDELKTHINNILKNTSTVNSQISSLKDSLDKTKDASVSEVEQGNGKKDSTQIKNEINAIKNTYDNPIKTIDFIKNNIEAIDSQLNKISTSNTINITDIIVGKLNDCASTIETVNKSYTNSLVPQLNSVMDNINSALNKATNMLNTLSGAANNMGQVFGNVGTTMSTANTTLEQIKVAVDDMNKRIINFNDKYKSVDSDKYMDNLITFLKGDPEEYGSFLVSPISIDTKKIYPVKNYGSAMTPFYTVLAIWVGMTILVSIVKVDVEPKKLTNVKSYHLYLGRLLTFLLLSALQTVIIVLGNIYLLKCQILHPSLFMIACLITSFTFTILIYSLTISFGDIGKALAVIIMVIQIAGSSGTFPIELLPSMNQNIYIFFPFPYAINALRETIGGMYGMTYIIELSKLLIFAFVGLLIGLVIRIPFVEINHYMEKRMKDTKMM